MGPGVAAQRRDTGREHSHLPVRTIACDVTESSAFTSCVLMNRGQYTLCISFGVHTASSGIGSHRFSVCVCLFVYFLCSLNRTGSRTETCLLSVPQCHRAQTSRWHIADAH